MTEIGTDRILHFFVCAIATAVIAFPVYLVTRNNGISALCGGLFALGLGLGKEYGDSKASGNKWDWLDVVADVAGIAVAVILVLVGTHA